MFKRNNCRLCGSKDLVCFLTFGNMPLAGVFLKKEDLGKEETIPLDTYFCNSCKGILVLDIVEKEEFFKDYRYLSSVTNTLVEHFNLYAKNIKKRFHKPNNFVVEIGCNDGILLEPLKKEGMRVLGVDPAANIVKIAKQKGLDTINAFFEEKIVSKIIDEYEKADVVIANQVFAHVDDLDDMTRGVFSLLKDDGIFVIEIHYIADIIKDLQYDMIYHEHMCYFSLNSLSKFLKKHGMEIFDVEHLSIRGGSIRAYAKKIESQAHSIMPTVKDMLKIEEKIGLHSLETYENFAKQVKDHKQKMITLLQEMKNDGKKIVGYGMSGRANTLLNYWKIGTDVLEYGIDASPERYGRYIPVMHIPIKSPHDLVGIDCIVLFAWIFKKEIMEKEHAFIEKGGKFLIPFPKPHFSP